MKWHPSNKIGHPQDTHDNPQANGVKACFPDRKYPFNFEVGQRGRGEFIHTSHRVALLLTGRFSCAP